jgi:hypothetical protein
LVYPYVPNLGPIGEGGNHQGIEYSSLVHEVEALDGVSEDADASDGQAGTVYHKVHVCVPFKRWGDVDP